MRRSFDPHREPQADFNLVRQQLQHGYQGPFLLMDSDVLREKVRRFKAALPRVTPHYAVKCNPTQAVLAVLHEEGAGFEIASPAELDACLALGVPAETLYFSNPMRAREAIALAAKAGVQWYVVDSVSELRKVHGIKPDASFYLRLHTSNEGSVSPLSEKFGVFEEEIEAILDEAVKLGADLAGATFHAGSQCLNPDNWRIGIEAAVALFDTMRTRGLKPRLLNLGGGFPVEHRAAIPSIRQIAEIINAALAAVPDDIRIMAEPGRFLVSDAGWLVTRVIGQTVRKGQPWAYLDTGVFNGLLETTTGIEYDMRSDRQGDIVPWVVAGPTCDSMDICTRSQPLPADLTEGDFVYVRNAGAYSNACGSTFNGFALPEVIVV
ncbi:type III PLP-dependent enzyme [Chitinimonas viridis]|uniref:ornithine decarboxylase n=1 Tax=Chitinimonas viridis TaxID=664880 RepID=A0ABT8B0X1_9NEIS|nr:type III PLP-dependent enzyme [Chitinimonas viridis]MDN3575655.1 type III PLP-dependent enzyme [Chitinimonas viridis]